jgi:NAD(P)-dependent dehydrogenase (short-subunit alcohol dehydrogenase family)
MANTADLFRLDGQVAVITGAAGLLGEQHAMALTECGAHVILADRDLDRCQQRALHLASKSDVRAIALECDVTKRACWEILLERANAEFGRVDILVNNAAYTNTSSSANYGASFSDFPLEDWHGILDVNLTGTFLGCQVVGEQMLRQRSGSIINVASLYGVVSPNHQIYTNTGIHQPVAYSISKAGVVALTRYLATLWAPVGVRVNSISPGGVNDRHSDLFSSRYASLCPMGRMARPDEMRGALIYLASSASSYFTGQNLVVDGGWTAW